MSTGEAQSSNDGPGQAMEAEHESKREAGGFGEIILARKRAIAALSAAMMIGDVEAVLAALSRLRAFPPCFSGFRWTGAEGRTPNESPYFH